MSTYKCFLEHICNKGRLYFVLLVLHFLFKTHDVLHFIYSIVKCKSAGTLLAHLSELKHVIKMVFQPSVSKNSFPNNIPRKHITYIDARHCVIVWGRGGHIMWNFRRKLGSVS